MVPPQEAEILSLQVEDGAAISKYLARQSTGVDLLGRTPTTYDDLTVTSLNLTADYGHNELAPQGLRHFRPFLEVSSNHDTAISYLIPARVTIPMEPCSHLYYRCRICLITA